MEPKIDFKKRAHHYQSLNLGMRDGSNQRNTAMGFPSSAARITNYRTIRLYKGRTCGTKSIKDNLRNYGMSKAFRPTWILDSLENAN